MSVHNNQLFFKAETYGVTFKAENCFFFFFFFFCISDTSQA